MKTYLQSMEKPEFETIFEDTVALQIDRPKTFPSIFVAPGRASLLSGS